MLKSRIAWLAIINAVGLSVVGAARLDWPAGLWARHGNWVLLAFIVSICVPVAQALLAETGEKARRQAIEREQKIQVFLTTSLIYIVRYAGADWEKTGVQVFEVKKRWKLLGKSRHHRVAKVRLAPVPSSGIQWTEGKGLIGRCWKTRTRQFLDVDTYFRAFENLNKSEWDGLSEEQRYGLSFEDFQRVKGKYGPMAAVPIINRREEYIGCVTADMPPGGLIAREPVLESLATTAQLVREVL